MNNKKSGNAFEQEFAQMLSEQGFWVLNIPAGKSGQPFDIIAVRNCIAEAIDCKVCEKDVFEFSRIEDNQASAMLLWAECGNGSGWFALQRCDKEVFMLSYHTLLGLYGVGKRSISLDADNRQLIPLHRWLER